jgi:hypothetical protein
MWLRTRACQNVGAHVSTTGTVCPSHGFFKLKGVSRALVRHVLV